MELVASRSKSITKTAIIAIVVAVGFAGLYYMLCMMNPALAKSTIGGIAFGKTIRVANMLRAFAVVNPFAVIGTGMGAHAFNVSTGTASLGALPIMPVLQTGVYLAAYAISKAWGRTWVKDLTVLAVAGLVSSALVALNLTAMSIFLAGTTWGQVLQSAVQFKLIVGTLTVLAGYPLVMIYDRTWGDKK